MSNIRLSLALLALISLTGCSGMNLQTQAVQQAAAVHGSIHGGQQPVNGASVQLYTVGTSGDYSTATALLATPVLTDSNGAFNITGLYSCTNATQVFLLATGGNPGTTANNPNLSLMAALGPCSALTASTFINVNEVTTVAAVSALAPFMKSPTGLGSSAYDANALAADFTTASQIVSTPTGSAPGSNTPSGYTDPVSLINTMGNILAACINSVGGTAGDTTPCGTLFTLATPPGGAAPTDTVTAMLDIANHPTLNTSSLYALVPSAPPFQPALTSAPSSYQVKLQPTGYTVTRTFLVEPDQQVSSLYALVNGATSTIDLTIYDLIDTTFSGDLVAACNRGVKVRVIMDQNDEKTPNTPAYNQLNAVTNCSAVFAYKKFPATHQKSFVIDGTEAAILTLNLNTSDYAGTRDFAMLENDPVDVAAIEATFASDYSAAVLQAANSTYVAPVYNPSSGNSLIWSPTTAQTSLVGIINNATSTLLVENEEMSAANIVTALENACQRGVAVQVTMTNQTSYHANFAALEAAGCGVHVYADSTKVIYIHAKVIVADYGTSAQLAYMGSINFSTASMVENRELGMYITDQPTLQTLNTTLTNDYAGAPAY